MKVFVVIKDEYHRHAFLSEELAIQYIEKVCNRPYQDSEYSITPMEVADTLMKDFDIVTRYWFHYDLSNRNTATFFLMMSEANSLDYDFSQLKKEIRYKEAQYSKSSKPRIRSIHGESYTSKRKHEIDQKEYKEIFRSICKEMMDELVRLKDEENWDMEQVDHFLSKETFEIV
ncbi:hypothetical protein JOC77_001910 [Peribacillus deserti]|uniref:Uncharacterized protein n=1 Tax=Peribacillus deserti TaxID=673318 RepID=A0ABS2QH35_9BACI|nr:hypothetical protein [Peribacillus deserti]MBM7692480.1 hypothetical protein [Peribacillus deserti]